MIWASRGSSHINSRFARCNKNTRWKLQSFNFFFQMSENNNVFVFVETKSVKMLQSRLLWFRKISSYLFFYNCASRRWLVFLHFQVLKWERLNLQVNKTRWHCEQMNWETKFEDGFESTFLSLIIHYNLFEISFKSSWKRFHHVTMWGRFSKKNFSTPINFYQVLMTLENANNLISTLLNELKKRRVNEIWNFQFTIRNLIRW